MLVRPRDLADRMSGPQRPTIFTLPIEAARLKAAKSSVTFRRLNTRLSLKTGGSLPTIRLSSRCDIRRLPTDLADCFSCRVFRLRAGYSTETRMTPDLVMPSARAALIDTSMTRPRMKGPRSLIRHRIERPAPVTVTMLPNGLVRWAQVISPL
jgi:hypothetical protein